MKNTTDTRNGPIKLSILALLYIGTCGLYFFYWYYQTTKKLYAHNQVPTPAGWRTAGLLVPILNIYLLWALFRDIKKYANSAGIYSLEFPGLLTIAFMVASALYRLPNLFSFLGFLSVAPIIWAQYTLNQYWAKVKPNLSEKKRLSEVEIIACLAGSALLIAAFTGAGLKTNTTSSLPTPTSDSHQA